MVLVIDVAPEKVIYERFYVVVSNIGRDEFVTPEDAGAKVTELLRAGQPIENVYVRDRRA